MICDDNIMTMVRHECNVVYVNKIPIGDADRPMKVLTWTENLKRPLRLGKLPDSIADDVKILRGQKHVIPIENISIAKLA